MPGTNQFLALGIGGGANTLTPTAYAALTSLLANGFQSGVANSAQFNTAFRQVTTMAAAIGQLIADQNINAMDDGVPANLKAALRAALDSLYAPASSWVAGDQKMSARTADHGRWLLQDNRTIGNTGSGATARANADTIDLYTVLWNGTSNADVTIQNSSGTNTTRGASAAADFAAGKRMPIVDWRGMTPKGYHNGGGNTTDTTRGLLSYEADGNKAHAHETNLGGGNVNYNGGGGNSVAERGNGTGYFTALSGNAETTVRNRTTNFFIYY